MSSPFSIWRDTGAELSSPIVQSLKRPSGYDSMALNPLLGLYVGWRTIELVSSLTGQCIRRCSSLSLEGLRSSVLRLQVRRALALRVVLLSAFHRLRTPRGLNRLQAGE